MFIYLDNAATTRVSDTALSAMLPYFQEQYGNPSSLYAFGQEAKEALERARETVAGLLNCEAREIIFTSGGSEADNQAIRSAAAIGARAGKRHIISTAFEHHAVLHTLSKLEKEGFEVTLLDVHENGVVRPEELVPAIRPDTCLVTVMYANNEIGTIQPIAEIGRICREKGVLFHTDAVQGFFKVPFRARTLGADLISVSAHKVHGIKGAGALYIRPGLSLPPFVLGGGQESGLRSGTEGLPAIAAFAAACRAALPKRTESIARQRRLLAQAQELLRAIDGVQLLGAQEAPHILNLAVPGVRSQGLINALQERDIYVSAGSACSKGHRSHVLEAMGVDAAWIDGSVRVSLSDETTEDDIRALAEALPGVLTELRGGGRRA